MEREAWVREYKRLLTAYNKTLNAEQAGVYFAALSSYPSVCVGAAVTSAIRESKTWPSAADLVERARGSMATMVAPAGKCDVCHGETWTVHFCAGVSAPDAKTPPAPVERANYCGRDWVHADHDFARRCYQCRPRREEAA